MNGIVITNGSIAFRTDTKPGYHLVLKDVNLKILQGEFVAVVGPNGSGKSTLAKVISRLLPLSKGTIEWSDLYDGAHLVFGGEEDNFGTLKSDGGSSAASNGGFSVKPKPFSALQIQMVFQNPDAQILGETVYEDICFGLENFGVPSQDMPARAQKALDLVGFNAHPKQPVSNLSGGQKQLLCIASCIAVGAQVLVFDESTAMLNPSARRNIYQLAQDLQRKGMTIVWVTQWMDEAAEANRIVALHSGKIRFDGPPRKFFYDIDNTSRGNNGTTPTNASDGEIFQATYNMHPTPCEALQFKPPYAVQVAHALAAKGTILPVPPLTIEELSEGVQELCQLD